MWKWAIDGQKMINEQSNQPLLVSGNENWNFTGDPHGGMNVLGSDTCIDCFNGNVQVNGSNPTTWTCNSAPWQIYVLSEGQSTTTVESSITTTATTTRTKTTTPQCIEPNTFYGLRQFKTKRSTSANNCRSLCMRNRRCRSFVWYNRRYRKRNLGNKCQLKSKVGFHAP